MNKLQIVNKEKCESERINDRKHKEQENKGGVKQKIEQDKLDIESITKVNQTTRVRYRTIL